MAAPRDAWIADAQRRARAIRTARNPQLRSALVRRVLFDLRAALRREPTPPKDSK